MQNRRKERLRNRSALFHFERLDEAAKKRINKTMVEAVRQKNNFPSSNAGYSLTPQAGRQPRGNVLTRLMPDAAVFCCPGS